MILLILEWINSLKQNAVEDNKTLLNDMNINRTKMGKISKKQMCDLWLAYNLNAI